MGRAVTRPAVAASNLDRTGPCEQPAATRHRRRPAVQPWAATALGSLSLVALLAPGCQSDVVRVGLVMRAPQGVLDDATGVTLQVVDANRAQCNASGHMDGSPPADAIQTFALTPSGCPAGAAWCTTITLDKDESTKVFAVTASGPGGLLAEGCATATINQDPLEVRIQVRRYNAPRCCGDGVRQAGEQCDTGEGTAPCNADLGGAGCVGMADDAVCYCDCLGKEILLSIDNPDGNPPITNGPAGTKTELALAFSGSAGGEQALSLRAVFTDSDPDANANAPDINLRMLDSNLFPFTAGSLAKQLRLPRCTSVTAATGPTLAQRSPAIAQLSGSVLGVVYASEQEQLTRFHVYLSQQLAIGCAEEAPIRVNATGDGGCDRPDIARGPDSTALVVWTDGGQVRGRIWRYDGSATGVFEPAADDLTMGTGTAGSARVAGSANGWLVAYENGGDVYRQTVSTTGAVGAPVRVNAVADGTQDQPDVAMLQDGRSVVVWHDAGRIFVQRYDAGGEAEVGDQDAALGVSSPNAFDPAVAGSDGGAFAVAWAATDGSIWARFLDGSRGFAYNAVTGQSDDFRASHPNFTGQRSRPAIAIGGAGHVAIGWQDVAGDHPGVFVRRFPLPE